MANQRPKKHRSPCAPYPPARQPEPEINVTPLVDVVLVLLIIFMVIAPSLQEGTPVVLPEVTQIDEKKRDDGVTVIMTADDSLLLDERAVSREELFTKLEQLRRDKPDDPIKLKADAKLPYAKVRDMFASLQRSGFKNVSLTVAEQKRGNEG